MCRYKPSILLHLCSCHRGLVEASCYCQYTQCRHRRVGREYLIVCRNSRAVWLHETKHTFVLLRELIRSTHTHTHILAHMPRVRAGWSAQQHHLSFTYSAKVAEIDCLGVRDIPVRTKYVYICGQFVNTTRFRSLISCTTRNNLRSVERGYLSNCFKSRSRDLGHPPPWGHSSSTVYYCQQSI